MTVIRCHGGMSALSVLDGSAHDLGSYFLFTFGFLYFICMGVSLHAYVCSAHVPVAVEARGGSQMS